MSCTLAALLCFSGWHAPMIAMEAVSQVAIALDAAQTAQFNREGITERESDCIIGHHPRPANVALYFGGLSVGHLLATNLLRKVSPTAAYAFQGLTIGWEGGTVRANFEIGARF